MKRTDTIKYIERKYEVTFIDTQRIGSRIKVTFERKTRSGDIRETWMYVSRYQSYDDAFFLYFQDLEQEALEDSDE